MSHRTAAAGLSLSSIRAYAERVGEHYKVYDVDGRANLDKLVRYLGGTVEVGPSPESLVVEAEGRFTIHIPMTTSSKRDRFTIAHELGHYFLHYLYIKREGVERFGRGLSNRAETEANTFAASLLMPSEQFRTAFRRLNGDVYELASLFGVSPSAAQVRCSSLGLTR
jgi:hypothetical protein